MNRTAVYKTPQFLITLIGGWLIIFGTLNLLAANTPNSVNQPANPNQTRLQVKPGRGAPSGASQQLQGAGGLQGQAPGDLQQSGVAERLQPNAKTDTFPETNDVQ